MGEKYSDTEIAQMFSDYVTRMQDKPRHTGAAQKETDAFDLFCESEFPRNVRLQVNLFDRMMNCAVEYEESGFIAGFKTAMALKSGQEEDLPKPSNISSPRIEETKPAAITEPQKVPNVDDVVKFRITSKQIAELFETTNAKVVKRIERFIIPKLDDDSRKGFEKYEGVNVQMKPITFYRLNKAACEMYLKQMEPKRKNYVNIAGGCSKLEELMEKVFRVEAVPV
ncbi:MAG: hypothetical protein LUC95_12725 [Lachnospiraceae bacterium]|nr:hypothetical protein [Lachnospiraceae bacterium]